ncbi:MAG: PBECR2 nuclease fold domain-containing protein [Campylobacter sputorum]|uniref:PBECR2 nuclease fold domain-containing protein n=1 Tax=Campylobacter sputorum TaxID=206 RepID=UPI000B78F336|nr:PBECR2 nuclease fold domain-containing protein [Campylobacter sputorum]ASM38491.1 hypothetical protein CSPARA_0920 [Campylobacter sputorum bv. paraureolyticus LMG 11764]MDY6120909.1 PBECR2 nuclease fold domain-containing protein [Campylobacter sputorum]
MKFFFYIGSKAINSDELSDARARGEQMVSKQSEFSDVAGEDINGDNFVMKDGSKARELGVELPPTLHSDVNKNIYSDGAGAKAHSLATDESITQKTKDLERLQRRNNEMLTGTPLPATTQSKASMGGDLLQHSDKNIVTQKAKNDINGDKQENNINQIVKSISNNSDIALKLKPKTDLLSIIQDFKEPIKTPIFEAKISLDKLLNHLAQKEDNKRLGYINLIKPTLEKPLFITKQDDRYRFVKTFLDDDKVIKYLSVIENENGDFIGITALPIKNTDLKNLLSKEEIVWGGDTLSALSTPQIAKQEAEAMSKMVSQKSLNKDKDLERLSRKQKEIYKNKGVVAPAPATALKNKADGELLNTKPSNKIRPQKATNEVLLKNNFENIKTFDDVKNNFLADMKLKDDDITLQNTKKTWSDELYGKKDSTALKINGKKVPLSEVEQYALKNEIDPIKKEILKKEIIYEKLKDDFTKKQKELSKIKNEKDLQKANIELKDMAKNIKEFELKNMNDDGKIISDLEIC